MLTVDGIDRFEFQFVPRCCGVAGTGGRIQQGTRCSRHRIQSFNNVSKTQTDFEKIGEGLDRKRIADR